MPQHTFAAVFASESVDSAAGVIKGVAVATEGDILDGRRDNASGLPMAFDRRTLETLMACAKTYGTGLKVKADHKSGIFAVTGYLKNFRIDGKVLRADLHVLATDDNRAKLLEMAQSIPDTFGLSVSFSGDDEVVNGRSMCRCSEIYSADLVSEPAANPNGLFQRVDAGGKDKTMNPEDILKQCQALITAGLGEFAQKFSKLESAVSALKPASCEDMAAVQTKVKDLEKALADAKTELSSKILSTEAVAASVAKEFAKSVGTSPAAGVSGVGAADAGAGEPKPEDRGVELVQKHYAATKSKAKAFALAAAEDKAAVEALVRSQKNFSYEKPAAKAA